MRVTRGFSLTESVATLAIAGIAILVAVPSAATLQRGGRLAAGTREVALTLQAMRWKSVAQRQGHGLLFQRDERGWHWFVVQDGNGNGILTAEVTSGKDRTLSGPHRLEEHVAGVTPGFPPGTLPSIPPREGALVTDSPIRFGRSDLIAFGPLGTSTSGTLYLTDGAGALSAISLFGPTARVRVWHFDRRKEVWMR